MGGSSPTAADIRHGLVFFLAGRAAEIVIFGQATAGSGGDADSDLAIASWLAAKARSELGLGEGGDLLWAAVPRNRAELRAVFAENPVLAAQVREDLAQAFRIAIDVVAECKTSVEAVADELVEKRVLQAEDVRRLAAAKG